MVLFVALLASACTLPQTASADDMLNLYLVRHAEKQAGQDPALTEAGVARSERLARILADVPVAEVWSTDTRRTRHTALPTAEASGLEVRIYDPEDVAAMAGRLRNKTGAILVVGHSNTVPGLAGEIARGHPDADFNEADYESLYRIEIDKSGNAVSYLLSYDALERDLAD
jgi:broad specificity phosphatase PhoE